MILAIVVLILALLSIYTAFFGKQSEAEKENMRISIDYSIEFYEDLIDKYEREVVLWDLRNEEDEADHYREEITKLRRKIYELKEERENL